MSGTSQPASRRRFLISGTAAAASGIFTVIRTSSEPAWASSRHCCVVEAISTVSVLVMDWTTTGAPPPTWILPTFTPTVLCRFCVMSLPLYRIGENLGRSSQVCVSGRPPGDLKPIAGDRHAREKSRGEQYPEFCYNDSRRESAQPFPSVDTVNAKQ